MIQKQYRNYKSPSTLQLQHDGRPPRTTPAHTTGLGRIIQSPRATLEERHAASVIQRNYRAHRQGGRGGLAARGGSSALGLHGAGGGGGEGARTNTQIDGEFSFQQMVGGGGTSGGLSAPVAAIFGQPQSMVPQRGTSPMHHHQHYDHASQLSSQHPAQLAHNHLPTHNHLGGGRAAAAAATAPPSNFWTSAGQQQQHTLPQPTHTAHMNPGDAAWAVSPRGAPPTPPTPASASCSNLVCTGAPLWPTGYTPDRAEGWHLHQSGTMLAEPCCCLFAAFCPCYYAFDMRSRVLKGHFEQYSCCQGTITDIQCGAKSCPRCCLAFESVACTYCAVLATRELLMHQRGFGFPVFGL